MAELTDEMTMVRELGAQTPALASADLTGARDRLRREIANGRATRRSYRSVVGWALASFAATAAAALVVPAVLGAEPFPDVAAPPDGPVQAAASEATDGGPGSKLSLVPAAWVLGEGAAAVRAQPDVLPLPEQFLYRRTVGRDGRVTSESWQSVDGSRTGLTFVRQPGGGFDRTPLTGCRNGRVTSGSETGQACEPDPAYRADLPTDADAMLQRLRSSYPKKRGENLTNGMVKDAWWYADSYLRPAQRAALFEAVARIPGLRVLEGATDAAGRRGTAVSWIFGGSTTMWIFDPRTHAYLGTSTETSTSALVDRVGERP